MWYNPATWTPVDALQNIGSQTKNAANSIGTNASGTGVVVNNPGGVAPSRASAPLQPAPQADAGIGGTPAATQSGGTTTGTTNYTPTTGYGSQYANNLNVGAINAQYDSNANWYNGLKGEIDPQKQADMQNTDKYYGDQLTGLQGQRDSAFANLDQQTNVANQSYGRSLAQLGNSIRNTYQGQSNAQGINGAGDSSANGMLGYALGQQNNLQRSYMNQDLNNQMTQVGLARHADQNQFDNQAAQIADLKQQQYTAIAKQYQSLTDQINSQLVNNESARRSALDYAGQWAASQANGVDQTIASALANSQANVNNMPQVGPMQLQNYTAHNVVAPSVNAQNDLSQQNTVGTPQQQIFSPYYKQDQNQYGV